MDFQALRLASSRELDGALENPVSVIDGEAEEGLEGDTQCSREICEYNFTVIVINTLAVHAHDTGRS